MSTYPEHVTAAARRIADRFYRRLPRLDIPRGYDLDELAGRQDIDGTFEQAATPERRTE